MILHINSSEYDYHTLVKVAEMAGLAGLVGFHESEDGYIVSFPDQKHPVSGSNAGYRVLFLVNPTGEE